MVVKSFFWANLAQKPNFDIRVKEALRKLTKLFRINRQLPNIEINYFSKFSLES
jgi:hypothetical protein